MNEPRLPAAAAPRASLASRVDWHRGFAPAVISATLLLMAALYWPSTQSLLQEWFEVPASAYRHGSLIAVITLWLMIRAARVQTESAPRSGFLLPLVLLSGASFAWLIGVRAGIQVGHQAMLPIIIWLGVWIVSGRRRAELTIVPIGLLYSAIPIWHVLVPALQSMTVSVVSALLRIVGIQAYVTGDFVHIRSGVFHVEDGCAGLHYFIVAATIAVLHGELRGDRRGTRVYLLGLAIALALASNWLRVFIIIVAGDLTDMQHYLVRVDHSVFGWVVFALAMVVFLLLARRLPLHVSAPADLPAAARAGAYVSAGAVCACLLAAAIGPAWLWLAPVRAAAGPNVSIPAAIDGWAGPKESCHGRWRPQFPSADLQSKREYSRDGAALCAFSASYLFQHQEKELIGYSVSVFDPDSEVVSTAVRAAAGHTVNEVQLGDEAGADRIVWYAYVVGEREVRRGVAAQLGYALESLYGAPASSVYALSAACVPDCEFARRMLTDFMPHVRVGQGATAN